MEEKNLNQILLPHDANKYDKKNTLPNRKINSRFFKFQFIFCSIFSLLVTAYFFYLQYDKKQNEALSKEIIDRLNITNLYKDYSAVHTSTEKIYKTDSIGFSIIGLIEIKSIGVYYPIINEFSYELLKIAPCKFSGPNPNEVR